MDSSHYYRLHWYWWGEAQYRTKGGKLELTSIPDEEWATVEQAALQFWDEIAAAEPEKRQDRPDPEGLHRHHGSAGPPYRYG